MIGGCLWWVAQRLLGEGVRMSEETYEALLVTIREDAELRGLS